MSIISAFNTAFQTKEERNWDKIYVFIDIHETILYPTYKMNGEKKFYPYAKMVLQYFSDRDDVSLGLYTCSFPEEIEDYLKFFEQNGIKFEHVNINNEVVSTKYGYFKEKPYFNVLIENKAGFDGEEDWRNLKYLFMGRRDTDPDLDCDSFTQDPNEIGFGDCGGDGHYMCKQCIRFENEERIVPDE